MSSEIGGFTAVIGLLAAAPVAIPMGAGWLAWQAGKLVIDSAQNAIAAAEEKRRMEEQIENARKQAGLEAHAGIVKICRRMQQELPSLSLSAKDAEALHQQLEKLCSQTMPEDSQQIENINIASEVILQQIIRQQERLKRISVPSVENKSIASLLEDIHVACAAMQVVSRPGQMAAAADPAVLERAELNERLYRAAARVAYNLRFMAELESNYGLSAANTAWYESIFNGISERRKKLFNPATSNQELRYGIESLEASMNSFDRFLPDLVREKAKLDLLYPVYAEAARILEEPVQPLRYFKSSQALEAEMNRLDQRRARAEKCRKIRSVLGPEGYLCYAWNEELRAAGYRTFEQPEAEELAGRDLQFGSFGEKKIPFYQADESLTQLYHIDRARSLQLVVQPDGTTTMQTISASDTDGATKAIQKKHCDSMKQIHQRLWENWFIRCDLEEKQSADIITTAEQWRNPEAVRTKERIDNTKHQMSASRR